MAPRLIKTILYTLISVNLLAFVFGGLVTWLSHSIPIRLRQFGLSPELTQLAGFSSLLIASLGLAALNFSSHYALNAYGISCAVFIVFMLFGILPDKWRNSIREQQQQSSFHQQLLQANYTSTLTGSAPKGSPVPSSFVLDLIYCALLLTFGTLLIFALVFAQYLRRHELNEQQKDEQFERSNGRRADGPCRRRNCTCEFQQAAVTAASVLGSLPNLNHQTSEDSLVPRCSSLSQSAVRWAAPQPIGRPHWQAHDSQLRQNLSSRSLVSLNNERQSSDEDQESTAAGGGNQQQRNEVRGATSSSRHQARRISNPPPPPPLVHRAFYYAAQMKDGASSQAPPDPAASYPEVNNSYRRSSRSSRSINNIDNTRCRCGSSVASTLAAKLQPLPLDYQPTDSANKRSHYSDGFAHPSLKSDPYACLRAASYATNYTSKARRAKPSGASVMAMTAAAAAALFGGVVDASPLEGAAGQGGADGMLESSLDDCGGGAQGGDIMEDYAHHYEGMPMSHGALFANHQHNLQAHHEGRCADFDDGHHELTGTQHGAQMDASLVYSPPWDYGPMMNEPC